VVIINKLPSDIDSLHKAISLLVSENESLTEKNKLLLNRNGYLTSTNSVLENENNLLTSANNVLENENSFLEKQIKSLSEEVVLLKEQLVMLRAKRFGRSSEKLDRQIEELELKIEEKELRVEEAEGVIQRNKPKRLKLPENLERSDITIAAPESCNSCGGKDFRKISDDISERLEYVPSSFKVIRYIRPRCACINCEKIMQGYAPSNTIDKGKAGPGMLAHIIIQKYCNHLPLYRQSEIYGREGVEIARSTMSSWAGQCAKLIELLIDELKKYVFTSSHIHGDDTPVKVLAHGIGKTKTGRIWTYVRDGRSSKEEYAPAVCYFYSPDRRGERPRAHLKDFNGVLHADAYSGYDKLYGDEITEAACWAHLRRKFYEVTVCSNNAVIGAGALEEIRKIYEIEGEIRGLKPEDRLLKRQKKSKELVEGLFKSFEKNYNKLPKKSMTGKAINYGLKNKEALMRFLEDGKIEIDNNIAERALRSIALGRKNWLFAGSDRGGETASAFYSLIETAKLNNINPWLYLKQVLGKIQDHNAKKISELLPWNIKLE
jgi:transposase